MNHENSPHSKLMQLCSAQTNGKHQTSANTYDELFVVAFNCTAAVEIPFGWQSGTKTQASLLDTHREYLNVRQWQAAWMMLLDSELPQSLPRPERFFCRQWIWATLVLSPLFQRRDKASGGLDESAPRVQVAYNWWKENPRTWLVSEGRREKISRVQERKKGYGQIVKGKSKVLESVGACLHEA